MKLTQKFKDLEREMKLNATNNTLIINLKSQKDKLNDLIDKKNQRYIIKK